MDGFQVSPESARSFAYAQSPAAQQAPGCSVQSGSWVNVDLASWLASRDIQRLINFVVKLGEQYRHQCLAAWRYSDCSEPVLAIIRAVKKEER